jgi:AraC-like DNA-binding protein
MSRSSFAARFTALVGVAPITYLSAWRLKLAHAHISGSENALSAIAMEFGYQSEAAFCRALKRQFVVSPGTLRR